MAAPSTIDRQNDRCVYIYDFRSDLYNSVNRQIRFQTDRIERIVTVAIYRLPEDTLINELDLSKIRVEPKATGDLRGSLFKPTTLSEMSFESMEALLSSLKPRQIYPINTSPNGQVTSFTINN